MSNKQFWIDTAERVVRTAAVTFYGLWQAQGATFDKIADPLTLKATLAASLATFVLALVGGRVGDPATSSFFSSAPATNVVPIPPQDFGAILLTDGHPAPVLENETAPAPAPVISSAVSVSYPGELPVEPLPTPAGSPA